MRTRRGDGWRSGSHEPEARAATRSPRRCAKSSRGSPPRSRRRQNRLRGATRAVEGRSRVGPKPRRASRTRSRFSLTPGQTPGAAKGSSADVAPHLLTWRARSILAIRSSRARGEARKGFARQTVAGVRRPPAPAPPSPPSRGRVSPVWRVSRWARRCRRSSRSWLATRPRADAGRRARSSETCRRRAERTPRGGRRGEAARRVDEGTAARARRERGDALNVVSVKRFRGNRFHLFAGTVFGSPISVSVAEFRVIIIIITFEKLPKYIKSR